MKQFFAVRGFFHARSAGDEKSINGAAKRAEGIGRGKHETAVSADGLAPHGARQQNFVGRPFSWVFAREKFRRLTKT
jgi:hypothetical protein